jgi:nitric oxide reductase NorD protein
MLATLLAAPQVLALIDRELPAARRLIYAACADQLRTLGGVGAWHPGTEALWTLVQQRLGDSNAALSLPQDPEALAWFMRACELAPATTVELDAAVRELLPFVRNARLAPLAVWGGIDAASREQATDAAVGTVEATRRTKAPKLTLRARQQLRRVAHAPEPLHENPLVHSFEKVHTVDEYVGGSKRVDGSDELAEHGAALEELEISELTRTTQAAEGMLHTDIEIEAAVEAQPLVAAPEVISYDEWDERAQRYRTDWCSVHLVPPAQTVEPAAARSFVNGVLAAQQRNLRELSAALSRIRNARAVRNRQPDGPDVDIDALVDRYAALHSGNTGPEKLYTSRRRHTRDFAVMLLLDASLSTDAWIAGQRVLDVAKSSLIVLGEVLSKDDVPTAIATFSSQTRKLCSFSLLKSFDETWDLAHPRIVSVEPHGYTRIGPALRHATRVLSQYPVSKRLLVLISDAKPTDYDRYEGRYGMSDVRKAINEAQAENVSVFALAIDARAAAHLPRMFERGRYQVMSHPDSLAHALADLYVDLMR